MFMVFHCIVAVFSFKIRDKHSFVEHIILNASRDDTIKELLEQYFFFLSYLTTYIHEAISNVFHYCM